MSDIEIDPNLLPYAALVDSSVLIPALDGKRKGDEADAARAFWHAMVAAKRRIIVATPSIAELLRGRPPTHVPRAVCVEVVPFDESAATVLATAMPADLLKRVRDRVHGPLAYYKQDALIMACGMCRKMDCVVTTDGPMKGIADELGIRHEAPGAFAHPQLALPYKAASPAGS